MRRFLDRAAPAASALAALALTLLLATLVLVLGGFDPVAAFSALVEGSFGSWVVFVNFTLVRAVPLILTGLAVAIAFKAGVWNIGAEGQLYAGAAAGVAAALMLSALPAVLLLPLVLLSSAAAGAAWASIPAVMRVRLGVGEVITTLLMNFLALELTGWLIRGPLQEGRGVFVQTDNIPEAARIPLLAGARLHWGVVLALLLAVGLWVFLGKGRMGFAFRSLGQSERASAVAGRFPVRRLTFGVFLLSGALAGLAGGVEISGVTYALFENFSPGTGYTAIAVALLAGLHPVAVVVTGVLFGALEAGASAMQRDAGVPAAWVNGIQALVILSVILMERVVRRFRVRPPDEDAAERV